MKMSKKILIAGVPTPSVDKNSGKLRANGCGTCVFPWDKRCREGRCARSSGPLPKNLLLSSSLKNPHRKSIARGSGPPRSDEPPGGSGQRTSCCREDGKLRCPAGASLWLSEVRQENAFTQRAVYLAYQTDCQRCSLRKQCLASGAKGDRARRVSAVRRLLPPPAPVPVEIKPVLLGPIRWVDVAGRALRRTWMTHWRRQYVEVIVLTTISEKTSPVLHPPRAVRSHSRWSWQDRLACNAWWGPAQHRVTIAGVPAFLAMN